MVRPLGSEDRWVLFTFADSHEEASTLSEPVPSSVKKEIEYFYGK